MRTLARAARLAVAASLAACAAHPILDVARAPSPPVIDGRLDDAAWDGAARSSRFIDILGAAGPRPPLGTWVRVLWDDRALYIAAELEEPHVWAYVARRDAVVFDDDDFEVFLDPDGDGADYFEIEVNARGTVWDLFLPRTYRDGGVPDNAWDARAALAVGVHGSLNDPRDTDRGWTVEMAVPWAAFGHRAGVRTPPTAGDVWRANFSRVEWPVKLDGLRTYHEPGVLEHNWVWAPQGVVDLHVPARWGRLRFVERAACPVTR